MNNVMEDPRQQQQLLQQQAAAAAAAAGGMPNINNEALALRRHELVRALDIKAAVERDERLQNLSDFEYAQWASTTMDCTLEVICERVYLTQCFREQYNLTDTLQECADLLCRYTINLLPRYIMSFDYLDSSKSFVVVLDISRHDPQRMQTEQDFRIHLGSTFYLWQAASRDFDSIRQGLSVLNECADATMAIHDQRVSDRYMYEFFVNYPKVDGTYYFINPPTVVNFLYGIFKRIIPEERRRAFKLGTEISEGFEGRRLDTLYLVPTAEAATARLLRNICQAIDQRYKNQAAFSLSTCPIRN